MGVRSQILNDVDTVMKLAFTWGYRWRKSYSDINSNAEVKAHSNFSNGYSPVAVKAS
jgi:patched 1 protein/patched 2 protein